MENLKRKTEFSLIAVPSPPPPKKQHVKKQKKKTTPSGPIKMKIDYTQQNVGYVKKGWKG